MCGTLEGTEGGGYVSIPSIKSHSERLLCIWYVNMTTA